MACALITGGAGFIGSHLAEELLRRGYKVIVIDDLSTGSIENIEHLKSNHDFRYTIETIMNVPVMAELVDSSDVVFHLAAAVGVRLIVESPVRTIETNIRGTEIVLHLANKKKKKVLIASTSEVYGKGVRVPFREEDDLVYGSTTCPRWSYACSKAIDEFLALAYWKEQHLPIVITRFFNTIGPRQTGRYGMVIPRFINQALRGEPISVYGDGTQTRSFAYVTDVVRACCDLVEISAAEGEVFNVGSDREVSINDIARMVKEKTASASAIAHIPYEQVYGPNFEDLERRVPDVSKIRRLIPFSPLVGIEECIERIIPYCRDHIELYR
jgi:UDP-glucose 4-epimerase